jgi:hypothetical protein
MKISIVTITCRTDGRLAEMARCLAATFDKAPDLELEWLIVDELHGTRNIDEIGEAFRVDANRRLQHFAPPATTHRTNNDKAVAHNTARNAGLIETSGDYVCFLNDCNMVTEGLSGVLRDVAQQGLGLKVKMQSIVDMKVPDDGIIRRGHHDLLRPVPILAAASACWGAPKDAFNSIHGFDLMYDGERYGNDLDAIVRLSRVGVRFVATERAYTLQLRRTKIDTEVTTRKDVYAGNRNKRLFQKLQSDKNRILPIWEYGQPEPEALPDTGPVRAARVQRPAPGPRIVQCPPARPGAPAPARGNPRQAPAARAPASPPSVIGDARRLQRAPVKASKKPADRFECAGVCDGAIVTGAWAAAVVQGDDDVREIECDKCGGPVNVFENHVLIAGPAFDATANGHGAVIDDVATLDGDVDLADDLGLD